MEAGRFTPVDDDNDDDNACGSDANDNDDGNDDNDMLWAGLNLFPNAIEAGCFALIEATGLIDNDDDDNDDNDAISAS